MDAEPSEDCISRLLEFGVVDNRPEAIKRLKANGNDVERTINAIFDAPAESQNTQGNNWGWDENQFHQGRDEYGGSQKQSSANTSEYLQPNVFGAPSRPPSRVNDRGVINLADEHARADPKMSMSVEDRNQHDMQKALELSMNPQQSGVTSNTQFGPATRDHYDQNQWALTTTQTAAHEIILDPDPAERKRGEGEPGLLKPSPRGPYLAPLLTILHSIPLGREALLLSNHLLADYGHDKEWWSGAAMRESRAMETRQYLENVEQDQIIHETQRLMAFLEMSDRSYASVDVLLSLQSLNEQNTDMIPNRYLEAWCQAVQRRTAIDGLSNVFNSLGVRRACDTHEETGRQDFNVLELSSVASSDGTNQTLYEAMDAVIWDTNFSDDGFYANLERIGDIFSILVPHSVAGKGLNVPITWYPDRYLAESRDLAAELREKQAESNRQIQRMERLQRRLTAFSPPGSRVTLDPRKMLESTLTYLEGSTKSGLTEDIHPAEEEPARPITKLSDENESLAKQLRTIYTNVTSKLESLDEQIRNIRDNLREMSSHFLTEPTEDLKYNPSHRYHLRGVSVDASTTYILRSAEEGEDNTLDAHSTGEQWWSVSYLTTDTNPVKVMASPDAASQNSILRYWESSPESATEDAGERSLGKEMRADRAPCSVQKVPEVEVLKAARDDGRSTLLVYANDKAVDRSYGTKLPDILQEFVRKDNESFAAELQPTPQTPSPPTDAPQDPASMSRSPPMRKASPEPQSLVHWGGQAPQLPSYRDIVGDSPVEPSLPRQADPHPQDSSAERPQAQPPAAAHNAGTGMTRDSAVNLIDDDDDDVGDPSPPIPAPVPAPAQEMAQRASGNLFATAAAVGQSEPADSEMGDAETGLEGEQRGRGDEDRDSEVRFMGSSSLR